MTAPNELPLLVLGQEVPLVSIAIAQKLTTWTLAGSGSVILMISATFWSTARRFDGLRWWTARVSLEKFQQLPEDARNDPFERLYYAVDTVRDRRRRITSLVRLALGLILVFIFSGAFQLLVPTTTVGTAWLFVGDVLVLPACLYYFAIPPRVKNW